MGLLNKLFGKQEDFGPKYNDWKGPWLVYNGERFPLDIEGLDGNGTLEVTARGRSVSQSMRGSFRGVSMYSSGGKNYVNDVSLEDYIAKFKEGKSGS